MPKYKPTEQDLFDMSKCAICGGLADEGSPTCDRDLCKSQYESFLEDVYDDYEVLVSSAE